MRTRLGEAVSALRTALRDVRIRRVQLAWSGMITAEWAIIVALGVWAYEAGGALGVGLMTLVRTIPAAVIGPFLAQVADRRRRDHVLSGVSALRVLLVAGVGAALLLGAPTPLVFGLAAADAIAYTLYWPAQSSLLTELVRRPEELVAANVTSTTIENVGGLGGPILAAAALGLTSPGGTVALAALLLGVAATALIPLALSDRPWTGASSEAGGGGLLAGFRYLVRERRARSVAGLYLGHTMAFGGLTVLVVVLALDALELGDPGVGLLTAAMGAGGIAGSLAALGLVGHPRLGRALATGVVTWAVATGLLGIAPHVAIAAALLAAGGMANALVDVAALTLLQRLVPEGVLARVLGVVEGVWWATLGVGGFGASVIAQWLGVRAALGITGVVLGACALGLRAALAGVDASATIPHKAIAALLRDPILGALPTAELERIALTSHLRPVAAGEVVIREGDTGEHYFVVQQGAVEAVGQGFRTHVGPGEGFGEIALLAAVPRTATVTVVEPGVLLAIEQKSFLAALSGSERSAAAADAIVERRHHPHDGTERAEAP